MLEHSMIHFKNYCLKLMNTISILVQSFIIQWLPCKSKLKFANINILLSFEGRQVYVFPRYHEIVFPSYPNQQLLAWLQTDEKREREKRDNSNKLQQGNVLV